MTTFQLIVNIGASLASILAIIITLYMLLWKMKKPLQVKRSAIFTNTPTKMNNYHFLIVNIKDYPITIKKITGYSERTYAVVKNQNQDPTSWGVGFRSSTMLFEKNEAVTINSYGESKIKITGVLKESIENIYLLLETSQRDQTIKCSAIEVVVDGNFEVFDDSFYFNNPLKAKIVYYGLGFWCTEKRAKIWAEKWKSED